MTNKQTNKQTNKLTNKLTILALSARGTTPFKLKRYISSVLCGCLFSALHRTNPFHFKENIIL